MKLVLFFIILWLISGCDFKSSESPSVEGLWELQSMKVRGTETGTWSDYRGGMQGYLLYDGKRNMSIHLTDENYENTDLHFPNFNDSISLKALKHLTKSYYYIGEYELLNDSTVQHTRISHSNPKDWGVIVQRHFSFSGDTLIIVPVESENRNLELRWLKVQ